MGKPNQDDFIEWCSNQQGKLFEDLEVNLQFFKRNLADIEDYMSAMRNLLNKQKFSPDPEMGELLDKVRTEYQKYLAQVHSPTFCMGEKRETFEY